MGNGHPVKVAGAVALLLLVLFWAAMRDDGRAHTARADPKPLADEQAPASVERPPPVPRPDPGSLTGLRAAPRTPATESAGLSKIAVHLTDSTTGRPLLGIQRLYRVRFDGDEALTTRKGTGALRTRLPWASNLLLRAEAGKYESKQFTVHPATTGKDRSISIALTPYADRKGVIEITALTEEGELLHGVELTAVVLGGSQRREFRPTKHNGSHFRMELGANHYLFSLWHASDPGTTGPGYWLRRELDLDLKGGEHMRVDAVLRRGGLVRGIVPDGWETTVRLHVTRDKMDPAADDTLRYLHAIRVLNRSMLQGPFESGDYWAYACKGNRVVRLPVSVRAGETTEVDFSKLLDLSDTDLRPAPD